MRTVTLYWKPRVGRLKKAATVRMLKQHYDQVRSDSECVRIKTGNRDTRYVFLCQHAGTTQP
jgi:hypothetical protein